MIILTIIDYHAPFDQGLRVDSFKNGRYSHAPGGIILKIEYSYMTPANTQVY